MVRDIEWHNKLRPVKVQAIALDLRARLDPEANNLAEPRTINETIKILF